MTAANNDDSTRLLQRALTREAAATEDLFELLYDDFHALAVAQLRHEPAGHTWEPTSLVHEAYLRLIDQDRVQWQGRTHFLAIGAQAMRRALVDHARGKARVKRGRGWQRLALPADLTVSPRNEEDVLALDEALRELSELDARQGLIVELRFFGGLTSEEVAAYLGVSKATVDRQWRVARAWLRRQLSEE